MLSLLLDPVPSRAVITWAEALLPIEPAVTVMAATDAPTVAISESIAAILARLARTDAPAATLGEVATKIATYLALSRGDAVAASLSEISRLLYGLASGDSAAVAIADALLSLRDLKRNTRRLDLAGSGKHRTIEWLGKRR